MGPGRVFSDLSMILTEETDLAFASTLVQVGVSIGKQLHRQWLDAWVVVCTSQQSMILTEKTDLAFPSILVQVHRAAGQLKVPAVRQAVRHLLIRLKTIY